MRFKWHTQQCLALPAHLHTNRYAAPHASVNIARAAAPNQHSNLDLLKGIWSGLEGVALLGQGLAGLGMPDVAGKGCIAWG